MFRKPNEFKPVDSKLFFSRGDLQDPRLGDLIRDPQPLTPQSRHFSIAGYPDDEGIRLNGGRLGASSAPDEVRRSLYKMTPPLIPLRDPHAGPLALQDLGNLHPEEFAIEKRHQLVRRTAGEALQAGHRWIGLGGGHDYGFPDGAAFCDWMAKIHPETRPLVINFDAHLDVRPTTNGLSSGTPFYRLLEEFPETDFAEIGIQGHCNSRTHLEWATARGARVLTQEEVEASGEPLILAVTRLLDDWLLRPRPVFLSIDIDGFSSAHAPGCSQSWATGFTPHEFFPVLQLLLSRLDARMLSIYEVSPPLDQDSRTARLAAQIIHRFLG